MRVLNRWTAWGKRSAMLFLVAALGLTGCQQDEGMGARDDAGEPIVAAERQNAGQPVVRAREVGDNVVYTQAFPTGERDSSALLVEMTGPKQVRMGQPFAYTIEVTNLLNEPLADVRLSQVNLARVPAGQAGQQGQQQAQPLQQGAQQQGGNLAQGAGMQDRPSWFVGVLGPNETRQIRVQTTADEVGTQNYCLTASFTPTLCATLNVINPELRLTKRGPDQVLVCEEITYTYTVANTGTGVARGVTIVEELPQGLVGPNNQRQISVNAGDINAGQQKQVTVRVRPTATGEYTSRAIARSAADIEAQSGPVTTVVRQPVLGIQVQGPEWQYVGQPITYQVVVANRSDVPARDTVLRLEIPGANVEPRQLGLIEPGQAKQVAITVPPQRQGPVRLQAVANAYCAEAVRETATTALRTIPALLLEVVDNNDPVQVGNTTVYQIVVKNQGSAPAENVTIRAQLPAEMAFVRAQGTSNVQAQGQNLTFAPVANIPAGEIASWQVEARAQRPGTVQFRLQMQAEHMEQPAQESEPTNLYQPAGAPGAGGAAPAGRGNQAAPAGDE